MTHVRLESSSVLKIGSNFPANAQLYRFTPNLLHQMCQTAHGLFCHLPSLGDKFALQLSKHLLLKAAASGMKQICKSSSFEDAWYDLVACKSSACNYHLTNNSRHVMRQNESLGPRANFKPRMVVLRYCVRMENWLIASFVGTLIMLTAGQ